MSGKLGYCPTCGDSLWKNLEHKCEPPSQGRISTNEITNPLVRSMFNALMLADAEFSGETVESGRARAAIRRVLWLFDITESDKLFHSIQTTAEACPPTTWD
jgi:hypothetical protein